MLLFSTNYLAHHGVKGQKWGVRHGPPYPIEDKVLRAGTKLNSVSATYVDSDKYRNSGRWMYTFNPDDEWDASVYKGPFSLYLIQSRGAMFIKEHQFEVVKDLKMPTKKERVDEFKKLLNDEKFSEQVKNDLLDTQYALVVYNMTDAKGNRFDDVDIENIKTQKDLMRAYQIFNYAMEASYEQVSTKEYVRRMSEKYDAMVDDHNQGDEYNDVHDPVIIFRANEALKSIVNEPASKYLTYKDVSKTTEKVERELSKRGKRVRL